ncbi:unnamed protein product [Cuscuta europaea]|uniref:Uncharacterized protein n=1 Tax=Cuscuta europaea TaxID=41803 RepID=A0A9P1EC39_CUSEU|nr:unnamed protein product [Cuscuta europaea]
MSVSHRPPCPSPAQTPKPVANRHPARCPPPHRPTPVPSPLPLPATVATTAPVEHRHCLVTNTTVAPSTSTAAPAISTAPVMAITAVPTYHCSPAPLSSLPFLSILRLQQSPPNQPSQSETLANNFNCKIILRPCPSLFPTPAPIISPT